MSELKNQAGAENCTMEEVLAVIGGKWALPIIYTLFDGKKRFRELERSLTNINTRMLVKELKNLERYGVVKREAFATVPPTVEYSLTASGLALKPVILQLHAWGQHHLG
jgi:DNA-binding HxlR family transcriptional regulator